MLGQFRQRHSLQVNQQDIARTLAELNPTGRPAIVHSSLSSFGHVTNGAPAVLRALQQNLNTLLVPAFSYYTLAWPRQHAQAHWPKPIPADGPTFTATTAVSSDIGRIPQTLLESGQALRSKHPALSFMATGQNAQAFLDLQTIENPYGPVAGLYEQDGLVLLLGVDMRSNSSIHYGEHLTNRPMLERWSKTTEGTIKIFFPNCSAGFNAIMPRLKSMTEKKLGRSLLRAVSVREIVDETVNMLHQNPEALLCHHAHCRCQNVRAMIRQENPPKESTPSPVQI